MHPIQGEKLTWNAMTCTLAGAELYFGLTAALDDLVLTSIRDGTVVAFPIREVRIASGASERIPMRIYSVRERSMVTVKSNGAAVIDGFRRVKLVLDLSRVRVEDIRTEASANPSTEKSVMAFLVAIGLDPEKEAAFFEHITEEFLDKAWMTLPSLLQEVGCQTPDEVADGDSTASTCSD